MVHWQTPQPPNIIMPLDSCQKLLPLSWWLSYSSDVTVAPGICTDQSNKIDSADKLPCLCCQAAGCFQGAAQRQEDVLCSKAIEMTITMLQWTIRMNRKGLLPCVGSFSLCGKCQNVYNVCGETREIFLSLFGLSLVQDITPQNILRWEVFRTELEIWTLWGGHLTVTLKIHHCQAVGMTQLGCAQRLCK